MPKLIVTSRYLKSGSKKNLSNYVKYIATRTGVVAVSLVDKNTPVTDEQKILISSILNDFPDSSELQEYETYKKASTVESACDFISEVIDRNLDMIFEKKNYVGYIANRPGAVKIGRHGLFSQNDELINLSKVSKEISEHKGNVWTHVVSLRRDNAQQMGYDNLDSWRELVRRQMPEIAKQTKINMKNLRWYAAFHDKKTNPHVHILVYSIDEKEGFLTNQGIERIRSSFANDIYHDEQMHLYADQTNIRNLLKQESAEAMKKLSDNIQHEDIVSPEMINLVKKLKQQLNDYKGKKVYGFLSPKIKVTVDEIFSQLAENDSIKKMYSLWCKLEQDKHDMYSSAKVILPGLVDNKEFKSIKNMIIQNISALNPPPPLLARMNLTDKEIEIHDEICSPSDEEMPENLMESITDYQATTEHLHIRWSTDYTKACSLLYDKRSAKDDFLKAEKLLVSESEKQNILAIHDLGKFFSTDKFGRKDDEKSFEYYKKALNGFMKIEPKSNSLTPYEQKYPSQIMKPVDMRSYVWYRIGKMHCYGLGTNCDFEKSFEWFQKSAKEGNKFAQFGLANQYYYGNGVEKDLEKAFHWYTKSALQGQPYAAFSVAKFYENGEIFEKSDKLANKYYAQALAGFMKIVKEEHADDNLFYKLGFMYKKGLGTEVDMKTAYDYFKQSADLNNKNAFYEYGKALLTGTDIEKDIPKAMECLEKSAELGNEYAQYVIDNFHAYENAMISSCVIGLFSGLCSCIADDYSHKFKDNRRTVDRKLRKVIQRQKKEHGIKDVIQSEQMF